MESGPAPACQPNSSRRKPSPEFLNLYVVYRSIMQGKGIDLKQKLFDWAQRQKNLLEPTGANVEFQLLSRKGCHPVSLAIATFAIEFFPIAADVFRDTFGKPGERLRRARDLETSAAMLERTLAAGDSPEVENHWPKRPIKGVPGQSPLAMVKDLRQYAKMYEVMEHLSKNSDIRSDQDLARFVITSYVHRESGRWCDKEVSAIISAKTGETYDETAHKMWRTRNFSRLSQRYSVTSEILIEIGLVLEFAG